MGPVTYLHRGEIGLVFQSEAASLFQQSYRGVHLLFTEISKVAKSSVIQVHPSRHGQFPCSEVRASCPSLHVIEKHIDSPAQRISSEQGTVVGFALIRSIWIRRPNGLTEIANLHDGIHAGELQHDPVRAVNSNGSDVPRTTDAIRGVNGLTESQDRQHAYRGYRLSDRPLLCSHIGSPSLITSKKITARNQSTLK